MKITLNRQMMFDCIKSGEWFYTSELAKSTHLSKAAANRFIVFLEKSGAIERIPIKPAPMYRYIGTDNASDEGKAFVDELQFLSTALNP